MAEPGSLNLLTTTSKIPLSAKGDDSDGAMVGMQFYVDGKPYGGEIPRIIGLAEEAQSYSVQLDLSTPGLLTFPNQGVLSLFAIGHDNSGNYVASAIHNLSYTGGSDLPAISLSSGFLGFSLLADELDLNISTSGEISKIRLKNGNRGSGLFDARIDVIGPGGGAVIEPIIGHDPFGADYGAITGFKVINPGSGYDPNNIRLQVVPIVRGINEGIPARVFYKPTPQEDENQTNKLAEIRLAQKVDGSLHVGSGYAIAPQLFPVPYQGSFIEGYERLPLAPPVGSTSSVADFGTINLNMDEDDPTYGAVIAGGFTRHLYLLR